MKNFIKYSLVVIVIAIAVVVAVHFIKIDYKNSSIEDMKTEMLQVQAKAKLEFEKYHINKDNGLKGEKIENSEYEIVEEGNFYKWTKETLEEVGLMQSLIKEDEYYLINYDTEEVIYVAEDEKHKLSEIEQEETQTDETIEEGETENDGEGEPETE